MKHFFSFFFFSYLTAGRQDVGNYRGSFWHLLASDSHIHSGLGLQSIAGERISKSVDYFVYHNSLVGHGQQFYEPNHLRIYEWQLPGKIFLLLFLCLRRISFLFFFFSFSICTLLDEELNFGSITYRVECLPLNPIRKHAHSNRPRVKNTFGVSSCIIRVCPACLVDHFLCSCEFEPRCLYL